MSVAEATPETDPLAPWRNRVHCGDCLEVLRAMPDNSVDSCVTDPPYGLSEHKPEEVAACLAAWVAGEAYAPQNKRGFMGKAWDAWPPGPEVWREVYRVLKPGAFCLVFAGTRTQDLMGIALRLAGFEIRDSVVWHYGNGFPKSLSLGKAIDKAAGAGRQTVGRAPRSYPDSERWGDPLMARAGGSKSPTSFLGTPHDDIPGRDITAPATDLAREWEGWGTALKPSHEPIIVAMKPCDGTFAENAEKWGVAGLWIDGGRVSSGSDYSSLCVTQGINTARTSWEHRLRPRTFQPSAGRWPPNAVFSHAPGCADEACADGCPVKVLGEQSGERDCGGPSKRPYPGQSIRSSIPLCPQGDGIRTVTGFMDSGTAARFFPQFAADPDEGPDAEARFLYCAKAARREREAGCEGLPRKATSANTQNAPNSVRRCQECKRTHPMSPPALVCAKCGGTDLRVEPAAMDGTGRDRAPMPANHHCTVKPLALMRWLCRLTRTPRGGVVLDPFAGSGTTLCAALLEGREFVGIEREAEYVAIAEARVDHWRKEARKLAPTLALAE